MTATSLPAGPGIAGHAGVVRLALTAGAAAALAYMAWPVLFAGHFEAVSYATATHGLLDLTDPATAQNPRQPKVSEFVYVTRMGLVLLLRALAPVFGSPDLAYRVLVGASLIGLIGAGLHAARAWMPTAPLWTRLLAIVCLPGLIELGYSFNDNIVSAALGALALACVIRPPAAAPRGSAAYGIAGLLLAAAATVRIDAVLFVPILAGLAWADLGWSRVLLLRGAIAATAFVGFCAAIQALTGYNLVSCVLIAARFGLHDLFNAHWLLHRVLVYAAAVGPAATVLATVGLAAIWRGPAPAGLRVAGAAALATVGLAIATASVPRYLYPIAYALLIPVLVQGLERIRTWRPVAQIACVALLLFSLFGNSAVLLLDGPRTLAGRLYTPAAARIWQDSFVQSEAAYAIHLREAETGRGPRVFLTAFFNEEYLLKHLLRQAGYKEAAPTGGPCDAVAIHTRGDRTIAVVPVDDTYWLDPSGYTFIWALSVLESRRCPIVADAARVVTGANYLGGTLRGFDPVQRATPPALPPDDPAQDAREGITPMLLDATALAARYARACEIVTAQLGDCSDATIHARYQTYLNRYARPLP